MLYANHLLMRNSAFDPDHRSASYGICYASYGTYKLLWQIQRWQQLGVPYLYLGCWIAGSRKMACKVMFRPIEVLGQGGWATLEAHAATDGGSIAKDRAPHGHQSIA